MNRKARRAAAVARGRDAPKTLQPASTDTRLNAAVSHHQAGRLADAKQIYVEILSGEPDNVVALHYLGVIRYQEGDASQAVESISEAIALRPDYAEAHNSLGNAFNKLGWLDDAVGGRTSNALRDVGEGCQQGNLNGHSQSLVANRNKCHTYRFVRVRETRPIWLNSLGGQLSALVGRVETSDWNSKNLPLAARVISST
ncbi:MAG: tetratricopeptide repeat protein [Gammaproteobacteria bacterium]|nr:tetratricopeptide repeat protein [Gammaproteobacteria bacterium]